jgi:hypothetical protein
MEQGPTIRFADLARRLSAASRASGLVVPAFRTPPRRAGVPRTIRRLPGGPVVAVRMRGRPGADVIADMVEGVIVANGLDGGRAARVREALFSAVSVPGKPGWRNRQTQAA